MEAYGSLDFAVPELAPLISDLANMPYGVFRFLNKTTHESMWDTNNDGTLRARLVRDWNLDEGSDGATYTFFLQEGAKWHDTYGDFGDFDADDFIFSIERISTPGTPHAASSGIRKVFGCDGCSLTKVDQYTVKLTRPQPTFEVFWHNSNPIDAILSLHSKDQFEAVGEEDVVLKDVGTGPWRIDPSRFLSGQTYTMESVQDHWFHSPEWETMTWTAIGESSTREANFLTGQLDTATFDLEQVQSIRGQGRDDIKYMTFTGQKAMRVPIAGLQYNLDHPAHQGEDAPVPVKLESIKCDVPFISCSGDTSSAEWALARNVRLAMTMAIDRQKLVNNLAFGEGVPRYADFFAGHDRRAGPIRSGRVVLGVRHTQGQGVAGRGWLPQRVRGGRRPHPAGHPADGSHLRHVGEHRRRLQDNQRALVRLPAQACEPRSGPWPLQQLHTAGH